MNCTTSPSAFVHRRSRSGGLPAALPLLAARSPVPVRLSVDVGRMAPVVEATMYFVCAEALANVVKHAQANAVSVTIAVRGAAVVASIVDDGVGGVDPTAGHRTPRPCGSRRGTRRLVCRGHRTERWYRGHGRDPSRRVRRRVCSASADIQRFGGRWAPFREDPRSRRSRPWSAKAWP